MHLFPHLPQLETFVLKSLQVVPHLNKSFEIESKEFLNFDQLNIFDYVNGNFYRGEFFKNKKQRLCTATYVILHLTSLNKIFFNL